MGVFDFKEKKGVVNKKEDISDAMLNEVITNWMSDSKNNAQENEKIFNSYNLEDLNIGLEENKPIFFCGKNERDKYIASIQSRLGEKYKLKTREYVYSEKVRGIVDKCTFTNGINDFELFISIYSYHNMYDFIPANVQAIVDSHYKEEVVSDNRNQNAFETVRSFFKINQNAGEFMQMAHTNYFISNVLIRGKYDSRIIIDAANYLGDIFNERVRKHIQLGDRDFGEGSNRAIEYFNLNSDAERSIDEYIHCNAGAFVDILVLDSFNEWFNKKYGIDLSLYDYYYFWYGQETPQR